MRAAQEAVVPADFSQVPLENLSSEFVWVVAFAKNAGLGFAIPYLHNGQPHDYVPDFLVRLDDGTHLILETKGFDPLAEVKAAAAERWTSAVNADGTHGTWRYALVRSVGAVRDAIDGRSAGPRTVRRGGYHRVTPERPCDALPCSASY